MEQRNEKGEANERIGRRKKTRENIEKREITDRNEDEEGR